MSSSAGRQSIDYGFAAYFAVLLVIGLIMLTSAATAVGHQKFGDSYFFIKKQLLLGVFPGLLMFYLFSKINYTFFYKNYFLVYVVMIAGLLAVFLPGIGTDVGTHAKSWLKIGSYTFQTSELAKFALIVFFAAYLAKKSSQLSDFKTGFLPALGVGLVPVILVAMQPDVGTASILFAIVLGMLFVANARLYHMFLLLVAGSAVFVYLIVSSPYRADRLTIFLHPELDPLGKGYHINQAMLAIGSGGFFGVGLGHSRQKFDYLPEVQADSIFAVMSEEMGFFFAGGLIILLLVISLKCLNLARKIPDNFGRYLISGTIIWLMAQSFLNIGAMIGLLPLTGVPLPFISHGGTALMIAMGGVGLMVSVSKYSHLVK